MNYIGKHVTYLIICVIPIHLNAQPAKLIFTEIMADPDPSAGLPESEFVEIYNPGTDAVQLQGWTFSDRTTQSLLGHYLLLPEEYVILCSSKDTALFVDFGQVSGVESWPRLNNGGDSLTLSDPWGVLEDHLVYDRSWYGDPDLDDGGYSMEIINPFSLCSGRSNWGASRSESGGTPGSQNSLIHEPDHSVPKLIDAVLQDSIHLALTFNEPIAPGDLSSIVFHLSGNLEMETAFFSAPEKVILVLAETPPKNRKFEASVRNFRDCSGNLVIEPQKAYFVQPDDVESKDVVINEILFNPYPGGVDFVEVFNRSSKYLNIEKWVVGNFNDSLLNERAIADNAFILEPGEYVVLTQDPDNIRLNYPASYKSKFLSTSLPSLPNEEGTLAIMDRDGKMMDHIAYSEEQHFRILNDINGVSLERVSAEGNSLDIHNWKSAAESHRFATPGYVNSQSFSAVHEEGHLMVTPKIFTPDSDGRDDFTRISYEFEKPGYIGTIRIFDQMGYPIRIVADNYLMGTRGFFTWDGIDKRGRKARAGYYIVHFQYFDLDGNLKFWTDGVVLGYQF